MMLHMNWQITTLLCNSCKLVIDSYSSVVVQRRISIVNSSHNWISLEVERLGAISGWWFLSFLEQRSLAFGGILAVSGILQNITHGVLVCCVLCELPHPFLIVSSLVADSCKLENALLLFVIEV